MVLAETGNDLPAPSRPFSRKKRARQAGDKVLVIGEGLSPAHRLWHIVGEGRRGMVLAETENDLPAPSRPFSRKKRARQAGDKVLVIGEEASPPVPPVRDELMEWRVYD